MRNKIRVTARKSEKVFMLRWIPVVCSRILSGELSDEEIRDFICSARSEFQETMGVFHRISDELPAAHLKTGDWIDRDGFQRVATLEHVSYYKALKNMKKYLVRKKKSYIIEAKRLFEECERAWKEFFEQTVRSISADAA